MPTLASTFTDSFADALRRGSFRKQSWKNARLLKSALRGSLVEDYVVLYAPPRYAVDCSHLAFVNAYDTVTDRPIAITVRIYGIYDFEAADYQIREAFLAGHFCDISVSHLDSDGDYL